MPPFGFNEAQTGYIASFLRARATAFQEEYTSREVGPCDGLHAEIEKIDRYLDGDDSEYGMVLQMLEMTAFFFALIRDQEPADWQAFGLIVEQVIDATIIELLGPVTT